MEEDEIITAHRLAYDLKKTKDIAISCATCAHQNTTQMQEITGYKTLFNGCNRLNLNFCDYKQTCEFWKRK